MRKITQTISEYDESNLPYEGQDVAARAIKSFEHLAKNIKEWNVAASQFNESVSIINNTANTISSQSQQISSYLQEAKKEKEKAQEAANAAAITKQEIDEKLENIDINGTASYTVDVVDDLLSRNRNMHFVGANII